MRYLIALVLCLFLFPLALADIGPSPDYSFSIGNATDYPEYKFYYAGNIWPEKLTLVEPDNQIYKLNTNIKVYAVPLELATDVVLPETEFEEVALQSVVSQQIDLSSGETVLEIKSFSKEQGTMSLEVKLHISDNEGFAFNDPFMELISILLFVVIPLAIIIVVLFFVVKFLKKQGKK